MIYAFFLLVKVKISGENQKFDFLSFTFTFNFFFLGYHMKLRKKNPNFTNSASSVSSVCFQRIKYINFSSSSLIAVSTFFLFIFDKIANTRNQWLHTVFLYVFVPYFVDLKGTNDFFFVFYFNNFFFGPTILTI